MQDLEHGGIMLVIKAYINHRPIDVIYIHNTAKKTKTGEYVYELIKPGTQKRLTKTTINHKRDDGYRKLTIKALKLMEKEKLPTIPVLPSIFGDNFWRKIK